MRGNVAGVNSGDDLQQWFRDIPFVTKFLCGGTFILGALLTFGLIDGSRIIFIPELLIQKFQIWRLISPFLFGGKFSFPFVMHLVVLYENCRRYENNPFNSGGGGTTADFIFALMFGGLILLIIAYFFEFFILSESLLFMIMYISSRRDPDNLMNMFGFRFKCLYLPWIYLGIRLVMGSDIVMPLVGIVVGHMYFFLVAVLPETHGYTLLKTPKFCIDFMQYYTGITTPTAGTTTTTAIAGGVRRGFAAPGVVPSPGGAATGGTAAGQPTAAARGAGYQWGRGNVLGARPATATQ